MEVYPIKNKQIEALCCFFVKNIPCLVVGVIFGISVFWGWYYWTNHHSIYLIPVSEYYEEISHIFSNSKLEDVAKMETFIQSSNNSYGVLAALQLAKYYIDQNDLTKAEQKLVQAQSTTKDDNLLAQINIFLARVQFQEKKWDHALKTLDKIKNPSWAALVQNTYGDVLWAKDDVKGAREAYGKAIKSNASYPLQEWLYIKLNNLSN